MEKLLYLACTAQIDDGFDGVAKKIVCQIAEFSKQFDTYLIAYSDAEIALFHNGGQALLANNSRKHRRYKLFEEAAKQAAQKSFSNVYIRYPYSDVAFLRLLKRLKAAGCRILIELPTYPYKCESGKDVRHRALYAVDWICRSCLKKYVARIVTFSNDSTVFSIPCINSRNGIDVERIAMKKSERSETLHLLAVASMTRWQGYDRLICGMNAYAQSGGAKKICLHLVGEGPQIPQYRQLVARYSLQEAVIFHGLKSGSELNAIFDRCDIGIAALSCGEQGISISSSLKSREYGARGLPMVTACEIDAFPSKTCDYILKVPEEAAPLALQQVVDFYDALLLKYGNGERLAQQIRSDTKARCDMPVVMKPMIDFFHAQSNEKEHPQAAFRKPLAGVE